LQVLDAEFLTRVAAQRGRRPENTPKLTASLFGEWRPGFAPGWRWAAARFTSAIAR
jgi:hypothetical protein